MLPSITNADCPFFLFLKGSKKSPISIHRKRAALDKVEKVKVKLLHHSGCSFPVILLFYIILRPSVLSIELRKFS